MELRLLFFSSFERGSCHLWQDSVSYRLSIYSCGHNLDDFTLNTIITVSQPILNCRSLMDSGHGGLISHIRLAAWPQSTRNHGHRLELRFHNIPLFMGNAPPQCACTYRQFLDNLLAESEMAPVKRPRPRSTHAHCLRTMVLCASFRTPDALDGL